MTKRCWTSLFLIILSAGISVLYGISLGKAESARVADFTAVYYGARCLLQHSDPYKEGEFLRIYQASGGAFPSDPVKSSLFRRATSVCINLPTTLFLITPIALLAWGAAQVLWLALTATSLILAAILILDLTGKRSPAISLSLICLVLANSEILFASGNSAGLAVGLCVVAVWCFLRERFMTVGILCLAVGLAIKPHDAGLVWLYFMLVGGIHRKRALQTLVVTVAMSVAAVAWVSHSAPNWMPELRANLSATSARGDLNDPGPESATGRSAEMVIDLQAAVSFFRDDPRIYNLVSYVVCGALILVWSVVSFRARYSLERAWLALAAIAALTLLVTYHRPYDAKLLLITIPACAFLWSEGGPLGWIAVLVNGAAITFTGDIPLAFLSSAVAKLHMDAVGLTGKMLAVLLNRPASLTLLAMAVFYVWVYVRRTRFELMPRLLQE